MTSYANLTDRFSQTLKLRSIENILHWDAVTMMPSGSAAARGEQLALLRVAQHELLASPAVENDLEAADAESLPGWQRQNLAEMRRLWVHTAAVPAGLTAEWTKACHLAEARWIKARPDNDFATVAEDLKHLLTLARQVGDAKAAKLGCSQYEALVDEYEPGLRNQVIVELFDELATALPPLIAQVRTEQSKLPPATPLEGSFTVASQRELGLEVMKAMGFSFAKGRLDVSAHPFCGGTADDVRITTRYSTDGFAKSLMGVIHETGHALYQQNLPAAWRHQPIGEPRGMAIHESQSLLMEMQAGRSTEFIRHIAKQAPKRFGSDTSHPSWSAENLKRLYHRVQPGLIRVDADEVTYPCHVIMRHKLEQALLSGDLPVAELPGAWREEMQAILGIAPTDNRDGCMQDVHWFSGAFGYFPTYTFGALIAAQLAETVRDALPAAFPALEQGDFSALRDWTREAVHERASSQSTAEIVQAATGKVLSSDAFLRHLRRRYLP